MEENAPTPAEWQRLYEAAAQIKALAPWELLDEQDIFGVRNPETSEFGFVSIMGALGEHLAISVYLGTEALFSFWELDPSNPESMPEQLLLIPQLQLSFEDRNDLEQKDRDRIKELGLKFRGRQSWPMFRSFRPGFFPWYLDADEVRFLTHCLEQTKNVFERFVEDPELLNPLDDETYLIRVPRPVEESLVWEDQMMRVTPPQPQAITMPMDLHLLDWLQQAPRVDQKFEIDLFMLPTPIQETRNHRPFYGFILLMVEAESGFVIDSDMLSPVDSILTMWGEIPMAVVKALIHAGVVPDAIKINSPVLHQVLAPLTEELDIDLVFTPRLPALSRAKESLMRFSMP
jgi:hypothetical protein